jgi:hypothetical protein
MQAVGDANLKNLDIDVRWQESTHDQIIFDYSMLSSE